MSIDTTSNNDPSNEEFKSGILYLLIMLIGGTAFLVISMTTSGGVSLYPFIVKYIVSPSACSLASIFTWLSWSKFKRNGYKYRDKKGATKRASPTSAAIRTILMFVFLVPVFWFCIRGVMRFIVTLEPGRPITTEVTVLDIASSRGCRLVIIYRDKVTSEEVSTCELVSYRTPLIGELITVQDKVTPLGAKLVGLTFH
jgi:hypothetical protein